MSALPREPDWLRRDSIACGSLVETYIHISRVRSLTANETAELNALCAWSDKRAAVARSLVTGALKDDAAFDAALAGLGRAPIPAVLPQRPARNGATP